MNKPFKKFFAYIVCIIISYVIVAGFAWWFVLGLEFPLWKIFIAGLLHAVIVVIQMMIFNVKQPEIIEEEGKDE